MKIYLSGPLSDCTESEIHDWRERVQETLTPLGYTFTNTNLRIWDKVQSKDSYEYIVESDLHEVDQSDIVLVYLDRNSVGCAMEIKHGYDRSKIVISVLHNGYSHVWIGYHSNVVFKSLDEALNLLRFAAQNKLDRWGLKRVIQEQL